MRRNGNSVSGGAMLLILLLVVLWQSCGREAPEHGEAAEAEPAACAAAEAFEDLLTEGNRPDMPAVLQRLWDSSGTRMGAYFATFRDELGQDYTHWQSGA